ncbi:MAG: division/cell wall cluster transcriptional repressor MraZ [Dehalococcoidia bacterium]
MFFGEYPYKVDEKGRVPLPPKFRRELKEGMVVAKAIGEKCIVVYSIAEWKRLSDSLATKPLTPANLRKLIRAMFANAFSASFDGQGRITLPYSLRQHAGIADTVIVVGANSRIELWSEDQWKAEKASAEEQASQIMESYGV